MRAATAVTAPPSVTPDLVPPNTYAAAINRKAKPKAAAATFGPSQRLETSQIRDIGTSIALGHGRLCLCVEAGSGQGLKPRPMECAVPAAFLTQL
jgi:hypothetical protein